jgi:hypothetical protein
MRLVLIKNLYMACIGFGISKLSLGNEMLHNAVCSSTGGSRERPHCLLSIHRLQYDMASIATVLLYKS